MQTYIEKLWENNNDKKIIAVSIAPQATFLKKICEDEFEIVIAPFFRRFLFTLIPVRLGLTLS